MKLHIIKEKNKIKSFKNETKLQHRHNIQPAQSVFEQQKYSIQFKQSFGIYF